MKNMLVLFDTNIILDILDLLQVAGTDHESVRNALQREDFSNSNIPAITPSDFLEKYSL